MRSTLTDLPLGKLYLGIMDDTIRKYRKLFPKHTDTEWDYINKKVKVFKAVGIKYLIVGIDICGTVIYLHSDGKIGMTVPYSFEDEPVIITPWVGQLIHKALQDIKQRNETVR